MKRVLLLLIATIALTACITDFCEARPTSAVIPAVTDSKDAIYNTDIFMDSFEEIDDYYVRQDNQSTTIDVINGQMRIDAGTDTTSGSGANRVYSRPVYLQKEDQYGTHALYTIETLIYVSNQDYHWMRVIDNGEVILYVDGYHIGQTYYTELWFYEDGTEKYLWDLSSGYSTYIKIDVYDNHYDAHVDEDNNGNWEISLMNIDFSGDAVIDYFRFGDLGANDYGNLRWQYFRVRGHVSDEVKYYENFNDGNAENFYFNCNMRVMGGLQDNPNVISLKEWGDAYITGKDYYMNFDSQSSTETARVLSPFIDIVRTEYYNISLEFKFKATASYKWFIIISDNSNICLYLEKVSSDYWLRARVTDPVTKVTSNVDVMILQPDKRYFLEVGRNGGTFDVTVDLEYINTYNVLAEVSSPRLRFGDFSESDYFDEVCIDNIMLRQYKEVGLDTDQDDITNYFENLPYCPIFQEDFEYSLNFLEYGWQAVIINDEGSQNIWEVGFPDDTTGDPDYGITFGKPNSGSLDMRSRVLATQIGQSYIEMNILLKSPIINIPLKRGDPDDYFTINISFWTWYDFEDGVDGGVVCLEYWGEDGGAPTRIRIPPVPATPYPSNSISELGNDAGFSGTSDRWMQYRFSVTNSDISEKHLRLVFETNTDDVNTEDWGWYIDDIKMTMTMVDTNGPQPNNNNFRDTDGDGLWDGTEFYAHGTSPMVNDTDYDGIIDGFEVSSVCMWGHARGGDPQVRNIFLEVDWLYKPFWWDHEPSVGELNEIADMFPDHDIRFYYELNEGIDVDDSDDTMSYDYFKTNHAFGVTFTANREKKWHYVLYAHGDGEPNSPYGKAGMNRFHMLMFKDNYNSWPWPEGDDGNINAHELGHNLGFFDYDRGDNYNGAMPPGSIMDYDRDRNDDTHDYLGAASDNRYDCAVDHTDGSDDDFGWDEDPWCYGGWRLSYRHWNYRHTGFDGDWTGGLSFRGVVSR